MSPSPHSQNQSLKKLNLVQKENVFLFVPNLLGYTRVLLALASLYYMPSEPWKCMGFYTISCILDAIDGNVARYYNQCTKFGAALDMVTDRCTTTCLLCYLTSVYPYWSIIFQLSISLDLSSHYMHMYSSLTTGLSSHKKVSKSSNPILRLYYSNNIFLFLVCALNELFFVSLYLLSFEQKISDPYLSLIIYLLSIISFPVCITKQIINVIQLIGASRNIANVDSENRRKSGEKNKD